MKRVWRRYWMALDWFSAPRRRDCGGRDRCRCWDRQTRCRLAGRTTPAAVYRSSAAALAAQSPPAAESIASIRRQAAERLKNFSQQGRASFDSLLDLYEWGRGELRRRIAMRCWSISCLLPATYAAGTWLEYTELMIAWPNWRCRPRSRIAAERVAGGSPRRRDAARRYGERSRGACRRSLLAVHTLDSLGTSVNRFSASWIGRIEAPADGAYTFSTTPINVNAVGFADHDADVEVPGQTGGRLGRMGHVDQRLTGVDRRATGAEGKRDRIGSSRQAASLAAGRSGRCGWSSRTTATIGRSWRIRPAMARLLWQGPGITKQTVPESALFPPQGDGNGLSAEYRYAVDGQTKTVTRREPQLDRVWFRGQSLVPKYAEPQRQSLELLCSLVNDPQYLATCESGTRSHVLLSSNSGACPHGAAALDDRPTSGVGASADRSAQPPAQGLVGGD